MLEALDIVALGLALGGVLTLAVLLARRTMLAREGRRRAEAEARLRPLAIALIEGEGMPADLDGGDARVLAAILSRYARTLRGEGLGRIASFFTAHDYLDRELAQLGDRRAWRRAGAAFALGDMAVERAVPALVEALGDRDRDVRTAATRSLGHLGAVEAAPLLVEALASGSVPRAVAGQALIAIGPAAAPELRGLLGDDDELVRRAAAEVLGLIGGAAEAAALAAAARDPAPEVRAAALRALGQVGGRAEAGAVRAGLGDEVAFVRTAAAHGAAGLGDRDLAPLLVEQARDDAYDPAQAAARALLALDPRRVLREAEAGGGPYLAQAATRAELTR